MLANPSEVLRIHNESKESQLRAFQANTTAQRAAQSVQESEERVKMLMVRLEGAIEDESAVAAKHDRTQRRSTQAALELETHQTRLCEQKETATLAVIDFKVSEQRHNESKIDVSHIDEAVAQKKRELDALVFKQTEIHHHHSLIEMQHAHCKEAAETATVQYAETQRIVKESKAELSEAVVKEEDTARQHRVVLEELRDSKEQLAACKRDTASAALKETQLTKLAVEAEKVSGHVAAALHAVTEGAPPSPQQQAAQQAHHALETLYLRRTVELLRPHSAPPNTPLVLDMSPLRTITSPIRIAPS